MRKEYLAITLLRVTIQGISRYYVITLIFVPLLRFLLRYCAVVFLFLKLTRKTDLTRLSVFPFSDLLCFATCRFKILLISNFVDVTPYLLMSPLILVFLEWSIGCLSGKLFDLLTNLTLTCLENC